MKCIKTSTWYNPLSVAPDNDLTATRAINAFYVFDKTGVILKHERGWFSEHHGFEINIPCVRKVKIDFNCKTAFLISHPKKYSFDDNKYDVYIPVSALGLQEPIYYKNNAKQIVKTIKTKIEGVEFTYYKCLDTIIWNIWSKIENTTKELSHYNLTYQIDKFDKALKDLKKLRKEYDKAEEYIKNYTVEMAIEEGF